MNMSIEEKLDRAAGIEEVADKMTQKLQEFIDAGEEGGSNMAASKGLLREYEAVKKGEVLWQHQLAQQDAEYLDIPAFLRPQAD